MQRYRRTHARNGMYLGRIAELLLCRCCSGRLNELAEPRSRVCEAPGGDFNAERVQRRENMFKSHGSS